MSKIIVVTAAEKLGQQGQLDIGKNMIQKLKVSVLTDQAPLGLWRILQ